MLYPVTICYLTLQYIAGYKAGCPIRVWLICSQIIHLSRFSCIPSFRQKSQFIYENKISGCGTYVTILPCLFETVVLPLT